MFYPNGKLKAELNYSNGKKYGISKEYYKGGNLKNEANYIDGKKDGISKEFYPSGGIRYMDTCENGRKTSRTAYDKEGNLKSLEE